MGTHHFRLTQPLFQVSDISSKGALFILMGNLPGMGAYHLSTRQIVQARMWAQGLTIALLIAAGALTQTRRAAMAAEVCLIYLISLFIYNSI